MRREVFGLAIAQFCKVCSPLDTQGYSDKRKEERHVKGHILKAGKAFFPRFFAPVSVLFFAFIFFALRFFFCCAEKLRCHF